MASGDVAYEGTNLTLSSREESTAGTNGTHQDVLKGTLTIGGTTTPVTVTLDIQRRDSLVKFNTNYTVRVSET